MMISREEIFELIRKYPHCHWDERVVGIKGYEAIGDLEDVQHCGQIRISYENEFFTLIEFKKNRSIIALNVLSWKVDPGMGYLISRIFLNGELLGVVPIKNMNVFKEKYFKNLKEENIITIQYLEFDNYEYGKSIFIEEDTLIDGDK